MEGGGSASLGAEREGALAGPSGLLHPFQGPFVFAVCEQFNSASSLNL